MHLMGVWTADISLNGRCHFYELLQVVKNNNGHKGIKEEKMLSKCLGVCNMSASQFNVTYLTSPQHYEELHQGFKLRMLGLSLLDSQTS